MKQLYFLLSILITQNIFAQAYDNTFNGNGFVTGSTVWGGIGQIERPTDLIYEPATQQLVMLNLFNGDGATLHRFNMDGSYDIGFGSAGIQEYDITASDEYHNVYLAGDHYRMTGFNLPDFSDFHPLITDVLDDGTVNTAFGDDGNIIEYSIEGFFSHASCLGNSGKYTIAGENYYSDEAALMQFNEDGSYNSAFGYRKINLTDGTDLTFLCVTELNDGRILAGGDASYPFLDNYGFIACFNADGSLDLSFGIDGMVFPEPAIPHRSFSFSEISSDAEGNIYATGSITIETDSGSPEYGITIFKLDETGNLITDFSDDGFAYVSLNTFMECKQILVTETNSVYLLSTSHPADDATLQTHIFKLLPDGSPDSDFTNGIPGVFKIEVPGISEYNDIEGTDMLLQDDGKIVFIGKTDGLSLNDDFFMGRITSNTAPDAITENISLTTVSLYPNPATNHINITSNTIIQSATISSIDGKLMCQKTGGNLTEEIDIHNYPNGIYILRTMDITGHFSEQYFVKE